MARKLEFEDNAQDWSTESPTIRPAWRRELFATPPMKLLEERVGALVSAWEASPTVGRSSPAQSPAPVRSGLQRTDGPFEEEEIAKFLGHLSFASPVAAQAKSAAGSNTESSCSWLLSGDTGDESLEELPRRPSENLREASVATSSETTKQRRLLEDPATPQSVRRPWSPAPVCPREAPSPEAVWRLDTPSTAATTPAELLGLGGFRRTVMQESPEDLPGEETSSSIALSPPLMREVVADVPPLHEDLQPRVECHCCGRRFREDRLRTHEAICRQVADAGGRRGVFESKRQRCNIAAVAGRWWSGAAGQSIAGGQSSPNSRCEERAEMAPAAEGRARSSTSTQNNRSQSLPSQRRSSKATPIPRAPAQPLVPAPGGFEQTPPPKRSRPAAVANPWTPAPATPPAPTKHRMPCMRGAALATAVKPAKGFLASLQAGTPSTPSSLLSSGPRSGTASSPASVQRRARERAPPRELQKGPIELIPEPRGAARSLTLSRSSSAPAGRQRRAQKKEPAPRSLAAAQQTQEAPPPPAPREAAWPAVPFMPGEMRETVRPDLPAPRSPSLPSPSLNREVEDVAALLAALDSPWPSREAAATKGAPPRAVLTPSPVRRDGTPSRADQQSISIRELEEVWQRSSTEARRSSPVGRRHRWGEGLRLEASPTAASPVAKQLIEEFKAAAAPQGGADLDSVHERSEEVAEFEKAVFQDKVLEDERQQRTFNRLCPLVEEAALLCAEVDELLSRRNPPQRPPAARTPEVQELEESNAFRRMGGGDQKSSTPDLALPAQDRHSSQPAPQVGAAAACPSRPSRPYDPQRYCMNLALPVSWDVAQGPTSQRSRAKEPIEVTGQMRSARYDEEWSERCRGRLQACSERLDERRKQLEEQL